MVARVALSALVALLLVLQAQLWAGPGSLAELWRLQQAITEQQALNHTLSERNQALEAEVLDLKQGLSTIEELARSQLGMVGPNETFFHIVEEQ